MVDVEGVKTTLKVGGAKHILLNISAIIEELSFFCKLMKLVFFNDEFHGVYRFVKNLSFKQYLFKTPYF